MDLHAGQVQGFFSKPLDHMTALFILTQYFVDLHLEDLVVVAPDVGRAKLDAEVRREDRRRPRDPDEGAPGPAGRRDRLRDRRRRGQDGRHRRRHHRHRRHAVRRRPDVLEQGARSVYAAATHGVFSGNAYENLASAPFEQIVVTDTIPLRARARRTTSSCCPAPTC